MEKKFRNGLLVGLGAAALALALWGVGLLDRFEFTTWTWRVRAFSQPGPAAPRVKMILLDQGSLDWGRKENGWSWPWPREVYSAVVDFCRRGGARAIAFDVLFTEPSVYGMSDDEALGTSIGAARDIVGAGFFGLQTGDVDRWPEDVPLPRAVFQGLEPWMAQSVAAREATAPRATFPILEVATNAATIGNVFDQPDSDGIFRRISLFRVFDGRAVPSLGLAAYLTAYQDESVRLEPGRLHVGDRSVPLDVRGRSILRFAAPDAFETFSAAAVIQSELRLREGEKPTLSPEVVRDAFVFFGFSAPGLLDLRPTPTSKVYPGVGIHATTLDNLLARDFLRDAPTPLVVGWIVLVALLAGLAVTLARRTILAIIAFVVFVPLPLAIGFLAYGHGIWLPVVAPALSATFALVGAVVVNYATEGRQKMFIKSAFRQYLSPAVIEQILEHPEDLRLGGEKRELSLFFSDIEQFSTFSERLEPAALTALLNDVLGDMTDIILDEGGTLDKYVGDAIVAFWNAPLAQPDHALRAARAALRCQHRLIERRIELEQRTGIKLRMRIGLNTGEVLVGNLGSSRRFSYTVLGDAANLASRIEGANKAFGTYLMASESLWNHLRGQVAGRELARLRVVGRAAPVRVYELTSLNPGDRPGFFDDFERAVKAAQAGRLEEALRQFGQWPLDPPSVAYAAQCRAWMTAPPEDGFDVWTLTKK